MKSVILFCLTAVVILITASCQSNLKGKAMVEKKLFGKLSDGSEVNAYTLKNANGMEVKIINYGAIVVSLTAPDKNGNSRSNRGMLLPRGQR